MKLKTFILMLTFLAIFSCKSEETQNKCLSAHINEISSDPEYQFIRRAANDTINSWSTRNLKFFTSLKSNNWQIDSAIIFNKDKSKAIVLLLEIDTTPTATFDYVKMLAAEKKEGNWQFYFKSMPTIGFDRTVNPNSKTKRPYTFKELSGISRKEIINGGYFKTGSCTVNYDYVNDWFKEPLAEYHKEFLETKVE
jgi:hypothetical protein